MDKLRGMESLVAVVESGGFAAGARKLNVSPPAVTQIIAALERDLGTTLFRRGPKRPMLTSEGEAYYQTCKQVLEEVREAELRIVKSPLSGLLIVGVSRILATHCIAPALPRFLARHSDLKVDLRIVHRPSDAGAAEADLLVLIGWPEQENRIVKHLAQTRLITCASPTYWRARGMPQDPDDLRQHDCLAYRLSSGPVLDLWKYERAGMTRKVAIKAALTSDDRDALNEAAAGGAGIVRISDLTSARWLANGFLQPVLEDWEALEAPPIHISYRSNARSSARVRAFRNFVADLFGATRSGREAPPMPTWIRRKWSGSLSRRFG